MGLKTALRGPLALFAPVSTPPTTGLAENSKRQATPRWGRALVRFERRFHTASAGKSQPARDRQSNVNLCLPHCGATYAGLIISRAYARPVP